MKINFEQAKKIKQFIDYEETTYLIPGYASHNFVREHLTDGNISYQIDWLI